MSDALIDLIGQAFGFGIFATPLVSYLIVRKSSTLDRGGKLIASVAITIALILVFFTISWTILFRNGLGPG